VIKSHRCVLLSLHLLLVTQTGIMRIQAMAALWFVVAVRDIILKFARKQSILCVPNSSGFLFDP